MKRPLFLAAAALCVTALPAFAEGDAEAGAKVFGKCRSCHTIADTDGNVIVKGGRTGPNLFGIVGATAASTDFRYTKSLQALNADGFVWDEEKIAEFATDPRGYLRAQGTDGKTRMTFKLKKGGADVAAYLATFGTPPAPADEGAQDPTEDAAPEATE